MSTPPPDGERPSLSLTDDSSGLLVLFLALLTLVYALVVIGNILFGVFLATVLVGGFLTFRLARRLLGLAERLVAARERQARAAETQAAVAAESAASVTWSTDSDRTERRSVDGETGDGDAGGEVETESNEWAE